MKNYNDYQNELHTLYSRLSDIQNGIKEDIIELFRSYNIKSILIDQDVFYETFDEGLAEYMNMDCVFLQLTFYSEEKEDREIPFNTITEIKFDSDNNELFISDKEHRYLKCLYHCNSYEYLYEFITKLITDETLSEYVIIN